MSYVRDVLFTWKTVFSNWKYSLLSLGVAGFFYVFSALLNNIPNIWDFLWSLGIVETGIYSWNLIIGFHETLLTHSFWNVLALSLLTGMLVSLIVFKFNITQTSNESQGFFGSVGVLLAFLVPGCASCGIGLLAVLGLGGALASLPFEGQEITVLATLFILIAIFKFSKDIFVCKFVSKQSLSQGLNKKKMKRKT